MYDCPACQGRLLEYLYDLLDGAERQAVRDHLDACPACRAELTRAGQQRQLLAAAARLEFPEVRFVPPAPDAEDAAAPAVVAMARPARKARTRWRWAAAAALLLTVMGLSAGGYRVERDYSRADRVVAEKQACLSAARKQMSDAANRLRELPRETEEKIAEVRKDVLGRQLRVAVVGQQRVEAGAPANYEVETKDLNGAAVAAEVSARLLGGDGRPVGADIPVVKAAGGRAVVTLPADLPTTPNGRLNLVVSARQDAGIGATVSEPVNLAPPAYLTYLETDKPMYQPGETVHYRSLTLDRLSLRPAEEDLRLDYEIVTPTHGRQELAQNVNGLLAFKVDGAAASVPGPGGKPVRGVGAGDFKLDPLLDGGEYTLVCREEGNRFPEQRCKFIVNNYPKAQLNKQLDFGRSAYGPGDEVSALCKAVRADGDPVRGQPVEATVLIDDKIYGADGKETTQPLHFGTDDQGAVVVRFKLPEAVERGEASLGVTFLAGAVETITRPLPIVLKKLNVEFYPEGGELAADLPNRVYFQARTPLGKPADLKGRLYEDGAPLPVAVETLHDDKEPGVNQGMGRFEFTPKSGKKYELGIESPAGIAARHALPEVKDGGVALSVPDGVADAGKPIKVVVRSKSERELTVGLTCRGRLLQSVRLKKGESEAVLNPADGAGGVCRVTAFEEGPADGGRRELTPVAERLIYRRPAEFLTVNLTPDRPSYVPGDKAKLGVETLDEKGKPAPAVVMLAVVDKSVLTLADEKTHKAMPTHFLLTSEVRRPEDLEYADFLLGPQAEASQALDLLLGVQGWRRFVKQAPDRAHDGDTDKEEAESLLAATGVSPPRTDLAAREVKRVEAETEARENRLREEYAAADRQARATAADPAFAAALARSRWYADAAEWLRERGAPMASALLILGTLLLLAFGIRAGLPRAVPYYAAAAACVALTAVLLPFYRAAGPRPAADAGDARVAMSNAPSLPPSRATDLAKDMKAPIEKWEEKDRADFDDKTAKEPESAALAAAVPAGDKPGAAKGAPTGQVSMPTAAKAPPPPAALPAPGGMGGGGAQVDKRGAVGGEGGFAGLAYGAALQGGQGPEVMEKEKARQRFFARAPLDEARAERKDLGIQKKAEVLADRDLEEAAKDAPVGVPQVLRRNFFQEQKDQFRQTPQQADGKAGQARTAAPMIFREYAHGRGLGRAGALRADFAETLYWHPVLVLPDGKADVSFDLCDSATTFQATAYAHTADGRLGAGVRLLESRLPLTLRPAIPVEATASDRIDVPLGVANNTTDRRDVEVTVPTHTNLELLTGAESKLLDVGAGKTARPVYRFRPTAQEGEAVVEFSGKAGSFATDAVRAKFRVAPEGFPVAESYSDVLEGSASRTVTLPETWVKGTLKCQVQVFPSTLADLQTGLEGLLREPNGCFEQTSTSTYPNLLILNYLRESGQTNPEVERKARDLLAQGYQKLTSFECTDPTKNAREGYEWFGGAAPPHEALTAYGLLQFRDMAKVRDVDPAMLKRTKEYLLSRRDGKGGFLRNPRSLDSFGHAPDDVTNAYIVWALTESGRDDDLTTELNALADQAEASKDPYFLSLVANGLINRARTDEATAILKAVAAAQKEDGRLDAATTSITGSGGRDLQIETTALAVLGWLKANPGAFNANLQKAVKWVGQQRGGYGGFGSTQSTILALKALIAYTAANKRTAEGGELRLYVGDKKEAELSFKAGASEALTLELKDAEKVLRPGPNELRVEITGKNTFPYTLSWTYQTLKPVNPDGCPVRLATRLSRTEVQEGDLVRLNVALENVSGKGQGMAVAVLGLPGGLTVPEDMKQLKQYTRVPEDGSRPLVDAFEVRGRELVLYWRDLAPGRKVAVPLDLIARVPGEYSGPASRGYLYYDADHKHWVDPLRVKIAAKAD